MNTRRCELCGKLHGKRSGYVSLGVPRADADYTTSDHYNLCEACSFTVYDAIEKLKVSDDKEPKDRSPLIELVQRQNAEIEKLRLYTRKVNSELYSSLKKREDDTTDLQRQTESIERALEWLDRIEQYDVER